LSEWNIPLSDLDYDAQEEGAVLRVLHTRWLSMGAEVEAFEREFAAFAGSKYAVAVANGTAALHLACRVLDLGPGAEVIQPGINFVAAANITLALGANPIFADIIGVDEPTIDPLEIRRRITPATRAVVVMHYGGYLARMGEILQLCREHRLTLIEDACHAVGARYLDPAGKPPHGAMVGSLGDVACFSFFSNKNMAVGEGGMLTTDRDDLARRLRSLRSHGMTTLTWDRHRGHAHTYDVMEHGYNYRLDEMRAALGRIQLQKLAANNERRKRLVQEYRDRLSTLEGWTFPFAEHHRGSSHHLAVAVAPDPDCRTRVIQALRESRIQTSLHYPVVPRFTAFAAVPADDLPRSRVFAERAITLPLFPGLTSDQVATVCEVIRRHT